jgi:hypothetical protein
MLDLEQKLSWFKNLWGSRSAVNVDAFSVAARWLKLRRNDLYKWSTARFVSSCFVSSEKMRRANSRSSFLYDHCAFPRELMSDDTYNAATRDIPLTNALLFQEACGLDRAVECVAIMGEWTASSVPMVLPAPSLFSTMNGCPKLFARRSVISRASV